MNEDLLEAVRRRFVEVNGTHPMSGADDDYVRANFRAVSSDGELREMLAERLPLPSYLLSDQTPMVSCAQQDLIARAGGIEKLHDWFVSFWPDDPALGEQEWRTYLTGRQVWLREVTPERIRQLSERVAQARDAIARLRRNPHDPIGRGMLGEAIDGAIAVIGLDDLLLPETNYDRTRLGVAPVRKTWVERPREEFLTPIPPMLPLHTERLVLRPYVAEDAAAFEAAWASPEWTRYLLSGPMNRAEVRAWVQRNAARGPGSGLLRLVVEHEGVVVGDSMLSLEGLGLSQGEIGWTVLPAYVGRGFATEAAREVLRVAFEHYGLRRVLANLDAENHASRRVCERLGMRRESHRLADFWAKGRWTDSFDYALLAEEWRGQAASSLESRHAQPR